MINVTIAIPPSSPVVSVVKETVFFPFNLQSIPLILVVAILCIVAHEFGHYLTAKRQNLNPRIRQDDKGFYVLTEDMTRKQRETNIINAFLLGLLPMLLSFFVLGIWVLLALPFYLYGCKDDFKKLWRGYP